MRRMGVRLVSLFMPLILAGCASDPLSPSPTSGPWVQVSAGDRFTCGLTTAGEAYCWGAAIFGQLGNDSNTFRSQPSQVLGGHLFRTVSTGSDHACGIAGDGAAWCWGLNDFRELGTITTACNPTFQFARCARIPVLVESAPAFDSIVAEGYATCGLAAGGDAHCWGWNDHGQKGSGAIGAFTAVPAAVSGGLHFSSMSLAIYHACGVTSAHALFCWGSNIHGQIGGAAASPLCGSGAGFFCAASPVSSAAGLQVRGVSTGGSHTCAITTNDEAWCWGSNQDGVLGNPNVLGGAAATMVTGGHIFVRVSAGDDHTCALDGDGAAWCWGVNEFGQLGVAEVTEACPSFGIPKDCHTSPGKIEAAGLFFAEISAGTGHTCGLTPNGAIFCWGRGTDGQLGYGNTLSSSFPVRVLDP